MSIALILASYFICWWLVLFMMLPIGMRTQEEAGEVSPGTPKSAPAKPQMLWKMLGSTIISAVIVAIVYVVFEYNLISIRDLPN